MEINKELDKIDKDLRMSRKRIKYIQKELQSNKYGKQEIADSSECKEVKHE